MVLDILFSISGGVFLIAGFIGCLLPILPGPPLALVGLIAAYFSDYCVISVKTLIICAIVTVIVTVLDVVAPIWFTKKYGGTKYGFYGATAGLIFGIFFGPFGIIAGPFIGALAGELLKDYKDLNKAVKAAVGTFIGFLFGTGIKLMACGAFIWIFISSMI
jgi:uncharacterized protein